MNRKREWAFAMIAILGMTAISYGHLLYPCCIPYSPHSDIIAEHLGTKAVLYRSIQEGHGIPFWRNDQFSGYPAFTNPQSQYTYPFHGFFYFLRPENAVG